MKLPKRILFTVFAVTVFWGCSNPSSDSGVDARRIDPVSRAPSEMNVNNRVDALEKRDSNNVSSDNRVDALEKRDSNNVSSDSKLPSADASVPSGLFLNGFFPIGAFSVPPSAFTTWKKRGVNTLVNDALESDIDEAAWSQAAVAAGFKLIRPPLANPADDIGNAALLAWNQMDEPDAYGDGNKNLPELRKNYKSWKQLDPTRPVLLNFGGSDVMSAKSASEITTYKEMIATADWIANDRYPMSGYLNQPARRYDLTLLSEPIDQLRSWNPSKPQFCFIESADISGGEFRGVKPEELRAQMWLAIVHGVRGIFFFSHAFSGGEWLDWDGTPGDVAAEMTIQNSIISSLGTVLQGEINPTIINVSVPKGLEAAWRKSSLGTYIFIVNPTKTPLANQTITLNGTAGITTATVVGESRTVPVTGGGTTLTDTFGAFAVHIYNLGP